MKKLQLVFLTVAFTACGQDGAEEFREAVPTRSQLSFSVPGQVGVNEIGHQSSALLGERAELYQVTRNTSRDLNGSLWVGLNIIESIVNHPPSSVQGNKAVWGPHTPALEPLTWMLSVEKKPTVVGHFSYVLSARKKNTEDEFTPIIAGTSRRGVGGFLGAYAANATALNDLDPQAHPATGKMLAVYDTTLAKRHVKMAMQDYVEIPGNEPIDFYYRFLSLHNGAGQFRFVARTDLDKSGSAEELLTMVSAWDKTGAGRGDALLTSGDLGTNLVKITECWDDSFERTYYTDNANLQPQEGDVTSCIFSRPADEKPVDGE